MHQFFKKKLQLNFDLFGTIKLFFSYFILKSKAEKGILFFFLLLFLSVQVINFDFVVENTRILGYDSFLIKWVPNPLSSDATIRHPLLTFLLLPLTGVVYLVTVLFSLKSAMIILYVFFDAAVAYSILFVYRICYEVVKISQFRSILLSILFSTFAHIIIQAFIFESYPLSLLLMIMTLYVLGRELILKEKASPLVYGLLVVLTAGVTITNGVKTGIAYLFTERNFQQKIKWAVLAGIVFLILSGTVYVATKLVSKKDKIELVGTTGDRIGIPEDADNAKENAAMEADHKIGFFNFFRFNVDLSESLRGNILGESVLFHTSDFKKDVDAGRDIYIEYAHPFNNWVIGVFYLLIGISIIFSLNQKYCRILLAFLSVDIFLHIVCRFGLDEPYIYAAHWLFLLPLFIALFYKKERFKKVHFVFDALIVLMSIFFLYSNWSVLFNFISGT